MMCGVISWSAHVRLLKIIQWKVGNTQESDHAAETDDTSLILCLWHSGLSNERTSENKNATLNEFYRRLEAEFVRSPEDYKKENVVAVVNVKKA